MSPESPQATTSRRASYAGQAHGNRSSGSPRHNKSKGGHYIRPNRASPKSLFQQHQHPGSPSRSPRHTTSVIGMVTRDDSANNNGNSTTLGLLNLGGNLSSFAGSKFNEAPPPDLLPKPPAHWLASGLSVSATHSSINQSLTRHLKSVLNVPIQS